jgi:Dolichyl-phosphate-mannose-protein mannosyltransferase
VQSPGPRPFENREGWVTDSYRSRPSPSLGQPSWLEVHSGTVASIIVAVGCCWRVWWAHATFFNTDEAWHYSVANQSAVAAAYRASLALAHPPLLIIVLYFWKHLGTSDLMLRFPGVLAGTVFCYIFFKWLRRLFGITTALIGVVFASLLPPMIVLSAELRQYSFMLMFAAAAGYLLERALDESSSGLMLFSCASMYLAMLSHYSAFFVAAVLGIYALGRMVLCRPHKSVIAIWSAGQFIGVTLAGLLYKTHISKLSGVYRGDPLHRFGDFYLSSWYFHPDRDNIVHFLWRGTFGIFRFTFGHTGVGQIAAALYVAGMVLLLRSKPFEGARRGRLSALLLISPFVFNWVAVILGLYPYGRTRQCIFLAVFGLAGTSIAVSRLVRDRLGPALALVLIMVAGCHLFGTLQGRDMLPLAEQRHEHMDRMLQFMLDEIKPSDVIFTDNATSFQLRHYLCQKKPVSVSSLPEGLESFRCQGLLVVATGPNDTELKAETLPSRLQGMKRIYGDDPERKMWVVQGGWASGLAEGLRSQSGVFARIEPHVFGRYLEVFMVPTQDDFSSESRNSGLSDVADRE